MGSRRAELPTRIQDKFSPEQIVAVDVDRKLVNSPMGECPSCGYIGNSVDGPIDPYAASSPACWDMFGKLRLAGLPQIGLDAYMAQHPNPSTAAGRRSILTHLVGLYIALNDFKNSDRILKILGSVFIDKSDEVEGFAKIPSLKNITVGDVQAASVEARDSQVHNWALFVWNAWEPEHERVLNLAKSAINRLD